MDTAMSVVAAMLTLAGPMVAQTPRGPVPVRAGLSAQRFPSEKPIPRMEFAGQDESQWLAGGTAGAVLGGLLGFIVATTVDRDDGLPSSGSNYVRAVMFSAAIGFSLGAIIGGQFKK